MVGGPGRAAGLGPTSPPLAHPPALHPCIQPPTTLPAPTHLQLLPAAQLRGSPCQTGGLQVSHQALHGPAGGCTPQACACSCAARTLSHSWWHRPLIAPAQNSCCACSRSDAAAQHPCITRHAPGAPEGHCVTRLQPLPAVRGGHHQGRAQQGDQVLRRHPWPDKGQRLALQLPDGALQQRQVRVCVYVIM